MHIKNVNRMTNTMRVTYTLWLTDASRRARTRRTGIRLLDVWLGAIVSIRKPADAAAGLWVLQCKLCTGRDLRVPGEFT